jgi:PemK-like, MazF-like toxin of type II toxin-antitoxin system
MRRGVISQLIDGVKNVFGSSAKGGTTRGRRTSATDVRDNDLDFEYSPCLDGDPDPGEVVWTWVPYEDDPSQGKDRPVAIIGRRGAHLLGVPLTSKQKTNELQVLVGTGSWDREGRPSYAKVERVLDVVPDQVRREGAVLSRVHFDDIVAGVRRARRQHR